MSYYYQKSFTSPTPIFAKIKEELKSYFLSGAMDEILFPTWVDNCLSRLGRSSLKIEPTIIFVEDFMATLPSDFVAIREAWSCEVYWESRVKDPGSVYQQVISNINQVPAPDICTDCTGLPDVITVTYKANNYQTYQFKKTLLLKPGNISKDQSCNLPCLNYGSSAIDSFDVKGNKFITNFRCGDVYIQYYSESTDENGDQMIPDSYRTKEYIEAYLKQKLFEMALNQASGESFKEITQKLGYYERKADEAFVIADTENKKETIYDKQKAIIRVQNRNNRFKISNGGTTRYY